MTIQAKVQNITPEMAEAILATSNGNRPLKAPKVQSYRRDMEAGNWSLNGEPIIIDCNGSLLDGHHRLQACVIAKVPFETMLVTGAPPEAQKTIDMGASRTSADALGFYGCKNSTQANAIIRAMMSLKIGRARSANPSTQEVFAFLGQHPEIEAAAAFAARHNKGPSGIRTMLGVIYCLADQAGEMYKAERFAEVLESGVPAYLGCAAHALRERLLKDELARAKVTPADKQLLILAAWEKFRVSAPVKTLKQKGSFTVDYIKAAG